MVDMPKPIGSIMRSHWTDPPERERWCKEVLMYSPGNPGDCPERRVNVYAEPEVLAAMQALLDRALDAEAHLREANRAVKRFPEGQTPPGCAWPFPTPVSNGNTVVWSRIDDPDSWEPNDG